jgi:hypothetical protein
MLPRIFTGTILSIGCVLVAQTAEHGFGVALEELNAAIAAPTEAPATEVEGGECSAPEDQPCGLVTLFAGELPPDLHAHAECVPGAESGLHLGGNTA